jgi:hypothetical protein
MFFVVNMLFVVLLMLDCLVRVYGVRLEDYDNPFSWDFKTCLNGHPQLPNSDCTSMYAARPSSPGQACARANRGAHDALSSLSGWTGGCCCVRVTPHRGRPKRYPRVGVRPPASRT